MRLACYLAAALLALCAAAHADTCERTVAANGSFTIACPPIATTTTTPTDPVVPVDPVGPVDTTPKSPAACPPNVSPFICAILGAGNPTGNGGPSAPAGGGNGTSFEDPTYDYRNGAIRRFVGSGTKTTVATSSSRVSFSIGDSGGNRAPTWHITIAVNGAVRYDATTSFYDTTPPILVQTGDVVSLTITGDGLSISARLAIS